MSNKWTDDQKNAIDFHNKNILVSAAAGSGKTAVLVERIIESIVKRDMDIDRLVVVTFTRAAASEMKDRIRHRFEEILKDNPLNKKIYTQMTLLQDAQITTIDSFCLNILRTHFEEAGIDPGFRVAELGEIKLLETDTFNELMESFYEEGGDDFISFVSSFSGDKNDSKIEEMVMKLYYSAVNNAWPEEWLDNILKVYDFNPESRVEHMPFIKYYLDEYKERLAEYCALLEASMEDLKYLEKPEKFMTSAGEDLAMLTNILKEEDYVKSIQLIAGVAFGRAPVRSKDESQRELQDGYISIRNHIKKFCTECSYIIGTLNDPEKLMESVVNVRPFVKVLIDLTKTYINELDKKKRERNIITFNDMEHLALNILVNRDNGVSSYSQAALDLQDFYQEILVDEYQDSNMLQEEILNAIAKPDNRYMVGDVKQSIYSFRKAKPSIFIEKYNRFSSDYSKENDIKIVLKKNFRSRANVLNSVNEIFNRVMQSDFGEVKYDSDAQLVPGAEFLTPSVLQNSFSDVLGRSQIDFIDIEEDEERDWVELEALDVAKRIKELIDRKYFVFDSRAEMSYRPISYKDIVILTRKERGVTKTLVDTLLDQSVPVHAESKGSYLETYELRPLISMLQIIDNPLDDVSFASGMVSFFGGFSSDELSLIRFFDRYEYLYKNMVNILKSSDLNEIDRDIYSDELIYKIRVFLNLIKEQANAAKNANMYDIIWRLVYDTGYYTYINTMPAPDKRLANIEMLINRAEVFSGTSYNGLFQFLRYIEKIKEAEEEVGEVSTLSENEDVVKIMSIHKSKGLEFPVVFVIGMDRKFNFMDSRDRMVINDELGIAMDNIYEKRRLLRNNVFKEAVISKIKKDAINEEMRLLYVALTRAKEKLFLIGSGNIFSKKEDGEFFEENFKEVEGKLFGNRDLLAFEVLERGYSEDYIHFKKNGIFGRNDMYNISTYMDVCMPVAIKSDKKLFDIDIIPSSLLSLDRVSVKEAEGIKEVKKLNKTKNLADRKPYPFENEVALKPKVTVTELKTMRMEEEEEAVSYRLPVTRENGASRGSAYHKVMELLDYKRVDSLDDINAQSKEWLSLGLIKKEDLESVKLEDIFKFIKSEIGIKTRQAAFEGRLKREQEFMIGLEEDGRTDKLIVQGTIDMYIEEEDGLILLDYKTDFVPKDKDESMLIERYRIQLDYYAKALEQVLGLPVKEKIIYSFSLGLDINL